MSFRLFPSLRVGMSRGEVIDRRALLRGISAASIAAGTLSFGELMAVEAAQLRRRGMACILLWMQGGPSHFETFSPKPGHENGGETKAISTAASGVEISDNFPEVAKVMREVAVLRSLTTKEGS